MSSGVQNIPVEVKVCGSIAEVGGVPYDHRRSKAAARCDASGSCQQARHSGGSSGLPLEYLIRHHGAHRFSVVHLKVRAIQIPIFQSGHHLPTV